MRLSKHIAEMGFCSRRKAETLISSGEVSVNGIPAQITTPIDPENDVVTINGEPLCEPQKVYILLNKPPGYLSTCKIGKEQGRDILELVKVPQRVFPVGRLDRESRGLLILTNDGDLAYKLTHPSFEKEKEYLIRVNNKFSEKDEQLLTKGISLNNTECKFHSLENISANVYKVVLKQGVKRQIRRMAEQAGKKIMDLQRVREGILELGDLPEGRWRYLTREEIQLLKEE